MTDRGGTEPDRDPGVRYGAGLPRIGVRELGDAEARSLLRRVRAASWRLAATAVAIVVAWTAGALASQVLASDIRVVVGGGLGTAACTSGALGIIGALAAGRRLWRWAAAAGVVYLLVVASLGTLAPEMRMPSDWLTWAVVLAVVAMGNAYLAAALGRGISVVARRRRILGDIEAGRVERYAGHSATRLLDGALERLFRSGWLDERSRLAPHQVELLPRSGLLLRVDGRAVPQLELAHVADVAPAMPHALRVALPEGVAPAGEPPLDLRRRSLTPAERDELSRHIEQLRAGYKPALATTVATGLIIGTHVWPTVDLAGIFDVPALLWYALTVAAYVAYLRRLLAARKLEADRKLRWVVTVEDAPDALAPPRLEVLPVSQLAWTENANPAGWRVSKI